MLGFHFVSTQPTALVAVAMNEVLLTQGKGGLEMFVDLPPDLPPAIMLTQAQQNQTDASVPRVLGRCLIRENNPGQLIQSEGMLLSFGAAAVNYLGYFEEDDKYRSEEQLEVLRQGGENAKVTIIQTPEHGRLVGESNASHAYYIPDRGYYGHDKVVVLVELTSGEQVTVVYFIHMVHHGIQESEESILEFCGPRGGFWKISLLPSQETDDLASWFRSTSLSVFLTGATTRATKGSVSFMF
jgi:hypothetical protein